MEPATTPQIRKLRGVASYQFGKEVGAALFDKEVKIVCSIRTGRIRHIYRRNQLIATLRPKDGYLALTPHGAALILSKLKYPPNLVVATNEVADFIRAGGDVFAKHVVRADERVRPAEEAIVTDQNGVLLGVGRAVLTGYDMRFFKRGVAVRIRRGVDEVGESGYSYRSSDEPARP